MNNYYNYWGKASKKEDKEVCYHLLPYHCLDVAAVTWQLLNPEKQRCNNMAHITGFSTEAIRYLTTFIMIIHDLGKFSKTFQSLVPEIFHKLFPDQKQKKYEIRHDSLGFLLWREYFDEIDSRKNFFKSKTNNTDFGKILHWVIKSGFGHHGIPPLESVDNSLLPPRITSFFDDDDINSALDFISTCFEIIGQTPEFPEYSKDLKKKLKEISWQIAGFGVLADWIGSNKTYFSYHSEVRELKDYWENIALPQAVDALEKIKWNIGKASSYHGISSIFPFIHHSTPLQSLAEVTLLHSGPELFIVEDVTGAGKTETAMILTSRIMSAGEADGFYIGLPTMATANAMFERMKNVYYKFFTNDSEPSIILSHGFSYLSKEFMELMKQDKKEEVQYGKDEETASAYCNEWFADNRKKSLLADVGVGTIDQALIGILPVRHQSLRLLGLQRKVLIVDEVHAYDPYMEHLLEVLLEAHARSGGSAILLSATIPLHKKRDYIKAFRKGLFIEDNVPDNPDETGFPLFTQVSKTATVFKIIETRKEVERRINLNFIHHYSIVLSDIVNKAKGGNCVCWIRNTVRDARKAFFDLRKMGYQPELIDLFHSRFAMIDRDRIEKNTIKNYGKTSDRDNRKGRILIATQVVEQSLDLDFDFMFSDLAPVDLLIQRAGRLHRHVRNKDGNFLNGDNAVDERGDPALNLFCPEFREDADGNWLKEDYKGTSLVYSNSGILWKTQRILELKKGWKMPEDARELIESVYGKDSPEIPDGLQQNAIKAEGKEKGMQAQAYLSALILEKGYCWEADELRDWGEEDKKATRLTEDNQEISLAVESEGKLVPYADVKNNAWDWSTLSISKRHWKAAGYELPGDYRELAEELKKQNPRLKHCEIVIVQCRACEALNLGRRISDYYDPRLGWGNELNEEA